MSLLQGDGFSHYPTVLLPSKWDYVGDGGVPANTLSNSYARFTDDARLQGLRHVPGDIAIIGQCILGKNLPTTNTGWGFFGTAFKMPTMPSQGYWIAHAIYDIANSGNMKFCSLVGADGSLNLGVVIANNFSTVVTILVSGLPGQVVANTWYTIESGFKVRTVGGGAIVKLNGALVGEAGGRYLAYTGNTNLSQGSNYYVDSSVEQFTHVRLSGKANLGPGEAWITDYYYCDDSNTSGDGLTNTFLNSWRLGLLLPNGVGASSGLAPSGDTPNWKCVDDTAPDDLATYVHGATATLEDSYQFEDIPGSPGTIYGLLANVRVSKDDATARTYSTRVKPSGSAASSIATRSAPSAFVNQQDPVELNPATSARFTPTVVNAAEFGVRIVS